MKYYDSRMYHKLNVNIVNMFFRLFSQQLGPSLLHRKIYTKKCTSADPANRGSPVCISTRIHPNDHMSMARSYGIPNNTSGDR